MIQMRSRALLPQLRLAAQCQSPAPSSTDEQLSKSAVFTSACLVLTVPFGCSQPTSTPTVKGSAATGEASEGPASGTGQLVASGFGQRDEYAWVTSLIKNASDTHGQAATVSFNLLDSAGRLLATASQGESFSTPGQELAVGTQVTISGKAKVAKVEATLDVKEDGIGPAEAQPSIPPVAARVVKNVYGTLDAAYEVVNPGSTPPRGSPHRVICVNAGNTIVGGGQDYPSLIPPSGTIRVDTNVITNGKPTACTAHPSIPGVVIDACA